MRTFFSTLKKLGISPEEFIAFIQEAVQDAQLQQEIKNSILPAEEQSRKEIRFTRYNRLIVLMQKERLQALSFFFSFFSLSSSSWSILMSSFCS